MNQTKYMPFMAGSAMAVTLLTAQIAPAFAQGNRSVVLESGTVIPVKLRDTLSSLDSRKGDRFMATLQSDEAARSLDLPRGTSIEGTVASVRPMQGKDPGVISLRFNRVVLPNESSFPIQGSLIGLDDKSVTHSENGRLVAKSDQKNKTLMYAGYGAGAGLLLGALTKGNAILDTLLGGGLGYLFGTLDKSKGDPKEVTLKPGTEMGVRLDKEVTISSYRDRNDDRGTGYRNTETYPPVRTDNNDLRNRRQDDERDSYDNTVRDRRDNRDFDSYQILKQYTDLRDNGRPIRVLVDGEALSFVSSARPFIANGVLMVPAIPVLKATNVRYTYTPSQFTADGPGEPLAVNFNSRIAKGSGTHQFTLPATVQRRNGTTYVPMQFLAIVTGQRLSFDRNTQTLELGGSSRDGGDLYDDER